MNKFIEYPDIPDIDVQLNDVFQWLDKLHTTFPDDFRRGVPTYDIFKIDELDELLYPLFGNGYEFRVQTIAPPGLPIHKDGARLSAYNYILDPGGDNAVTCFYDEDVNQIGKVCIPARTWHKLLNLRSFHNVRNITQMRVAISVFEKIEGLTPVALEGRFN